MAQEETSIKIREDLFDICDNEINPQEEEELLEMNTEQFITDKEIIPEDEHFEIDTTEKQCNSHKSDNNNRFVKIGNIRTSVQKKISSIKPTIRRDVISTNCQNSSDNSDDSNQDDEEKAPTRNIKNTFGSFMVDATIARWKPELDCDICSEKFSLYSEIKSHYRSRHPKSTFSISCCGRVLKKRCIIDEHARVHNNPKAFQCKDCGKCFTGKLFLEDHSRCHLPGGRQYKHICDICGRNYRLQSALLEHYVIHMGKKISHCKYCDKKFKYRFHLYLHMNNIHPDKVKYRTEHKCTLCPSIFKYATVLNRHILNEHSESLTQQMEKVK